MDSVEDSAGHLVPPSCFPSIAQKPADIDAKHKEFLKASREKPAGTAIADMSHQDAIR